MRKKMILKPRNGLVIKLDCQQINLNMSITITHLQKTEWENCGHQFAATQNIRQQALIYYLEYKQYLRQNSNFIESESKVQDLMLIAYFISEKSQVVYDIKGNKISNLAFSINQLVKKHNDYKDFFYHLKQMMRTITLPVQARQAEEEINAFMKYFSFIMTFYNKYLSTFDKITVCHNIHIKDLEALGGQYEYINKIKYLLWIVYICFKKTVFKNTMDTIVNTCLLVCLFSYFVDKIYKQEKITSVYAPLMVEDLGTFPNQYNQIEEICLNYFCLKDFKTYQQVRNTFIKFIQSITFLLPELKHPFAPKLIHLNIKKLQDIYQKKKDYFQIDETLFLKNLVSNQQNIKFTAFGAKRKIKNYHSNNFFQSRRALNYQAEIKNAQQIATNTKNPLQNQENSQGNYLDVMKRIKCSQTPVILIQATPVTQFANAYNWLHKKSLNKSENEVSLNLEELLKIGYRQDIYQMKNSQILQKQNLIEGLFNELLMQYAEQSQQTINVASILAFQVFSYIMNITNRDICELVDELNISWYSVWQGVDILLNYDKSMPNNVKTHLLLLQTSIVSSFIWKETSFVESLSEVALSEGYKNFFYRVLHHIAYQVHFICKGIGLPDNVMDQAFVICQFYLKELSPMMQNVNLDIVIMCSIYGVCRAKSMDMKFKAIISVYKSVNNMDDKTFETIQKFEESQNEDFSIVAAIIKFYNSDFVPYCKSILMKAKDQTLKEDKQISSSSYVLSPVKEILPSGLILRRSCFGTPSQSQMLSAYNESPLLRRNRKLNLNHNLVQNKENIDAMNYPAKKLYNQSQTLRQRSSNVSLMLQQKCTFKKQLSRQQQKVYFGPEIVSYQTLKLKSGIYNQLKSILNQQQNIRVSQRQHYI